MFKSCMRRKLPCCPADRRRPLVRQPEVAEEPTRSRPQPRTRPTDKGCSLKRLLRSPCPQRPSSHHAHLTRPSSPALIARPPDDLLSCAAGGRRYPAAVAAFALAPSAPALGRPGALRDLWPACRRRRPRDGRRRDARSGSFISRLLPPQLLTGCDLGGRQIRELLYKVRGGGTP